VVKSEKKKKSDPLISVLGRPKVPGFVDNRRFEGPITEMVDEAETYIMSAMRKSSLIDGMFRRDITEYPRESLRESIANAVAHRDYSPYVRGSYIQIRMFADRLEVRSPGGLFVYKKTRLYH
jgi:ATP-dependent DNA helicase RecG